MKCPSCSKRISWGQGRRFTTPLGARRAADCPHCASKLVWSKWPYRSSCAAVFVMFVAVALRYVAPLEIVKDLYLHFVLGIIAWIMIAVGLFKSRLEVANEIGP